MAAGLETLRDDGIDAALLEPERFGDGRRARDDARAARAHALEQRRIGKAVVEADDARPQLLDECGADGVERDPGRAGGNGRRVDAELAVVRRQRGSPRCFARRSGTGARWQKKLTLNGSSVATRMASNSRLIAATSSIAHGNEPRPPAWQTAIASALPCAPAIGAWITGSWTPNDRCSSIAILS